MKIGYPNHPRKDLLEEIEWIGKNGFDFVDLFLEEDLAAPHMVDIKATKKLLKKYNLSTVGHTPWYLPTGSPSKTIRDAAVTEANKCFEVFTQLNVKFVTIHSNWPPKLFSLKEGIKFQVETLRKIVRNAKAFDISIVYEPIDSPYDNVKNIAEILDSVPDLYLHIDIGHANLSGRNPEEFIKKLHKRLKHIHLHDNDGNRDLHLPIGAGKINWGRLIRVLKKYYDGTITLEIFSQDRDFVLLSKEKLKTLWGNY